MRNVDTSQDGELTCPACSHATPATPSTMLNLLRAAGLMRRDSDPPRELLVELCRHSLARLRCPVCGQCGLQARSATSVEWPAGRRCETCGQPIEAERLEALPTTTQCAACARSPTSGPDEREFCPRCGDLLQLRLATGTALTRYVRYCPTCKS